MIEPDTAKTLRRLGRRVHTARSERNSAIIRAHADGASLREIAALVGISHVAVHKIVHKASNERSQI